MLARESQKDYFLPFSSAFGSDTRNSRAPLVLFQARDKWLKYYDSIFLRYYWTKNNLRLPLWISPRLKMSCRITMTCLQELSLPHKFSTTIIFSEMV
jgi:hypothetical protein